MNKSDFYNCKSVNLQKYVDSSDCSLDIQAAEALAKAFSMWSEVKFFDQELHLLSINISYVSDMVLSSDLLSVIKTFALMQNFDIMGWSDEIRSVYEDEE